MNDNLLSFLGLCRRAGKMSLGNDVVLSSIANGTARIVIITNDISTHTLKGIVNVSSHFNKKIYKINVTKDELGLAIGKYSAVISINDRGFAKKIVTLIIDNNNQLGEEYHI